MSPACACTRPRRRRMAGLIHCGEDRRRNHGTSAAPPHPHRAPTSARARATPSPGVSARKRSPVRAPAAGPAGKRRPTARPCGARHCSGLAKLLPYAGDKAAGDKAASDKAAGDNAARNRRRPDSNANQAAATRATSTADAPHSDRTPIMLTNPHRLTQRPASRGSRPHRAPLSHCSRRGEASAPPHATPRHARREHTHRRVRRPAAGEAEGHHDGRRDSRPPGHGGGHGRWPFDACAACGPPRAAAPRSSTAAVQPQQFNASRALHSNRRREPCKT